MKQSLKRKEVFLTDEVVELLQKKADAQHRPLKNYLESVLIEESKKE
jgi:hypothetical protein